MSAELPARLGKYEIRSQLGAGAMGTVYLAYDPFIARPVAVKTIRKDLLDSRHGPPLVARFRNEAMAAGRLSHPGIVAVYDYGEDESTAYIVMEYAPGEDLSAYAQRSRLTLLEIGALMAELCDALQYAHDAGVVHRDIKPSNLIVTRVDAAVTTGAPPPRGRLKITDFGIARLDTSDLTQTGMALGTPSYMAPEQYAAQNVDHRADLWASGVLLYQLLTRRLPFEGATIQTVAYQVCHVDPVPPSVVAPHVLPALDPVVLRALAKSKENRFGSARELASAVAAALSGWAPALPRSPVSAPPPPLQVPTPIAAPALPALSFAATDSAAAVQGWSPDVLRALESVLAPLVGAVAGPLVRRSAAKTADPELLVTLLTASADDPAARTKLARILRAAIGAPPASATAASPGPSASIAPPAKGLSIGEQMRGATPEDLERLTQVLAGTIGPIAKIVVQKASAQAKSYRELCVRVSERLPTPEERARFLARVGGG